MCMDRIVSIGEIRTAWGSGEKNLKWLCGTFTLCTSLRPNKQNQNVNYRRKLPEQSDVDTDILNIGHI